MPDYFSEAWIPVTINSQDSNEDVTATGVPRKPCSRCGKKRAINRLHNIDNALVCKECLEVYYEVCVICGSAHDKSSFVNAYRGRLCKRCFDRFYKKCEECGCLEHESFCRTISGKYYCLDCHDMLFFTCVNCGIALTQEEVSFDEEHSNYYCKPCYKKQIWRRLIKQYSFKPNYIYKKSRWEIAEMKDDCMPSALYMGFELELQHNENEIVEKTIDFRNFLSSLKLIKLFSLKSDSSIGENGFELVSHPFTLQFAQKEKRYRLKDIIEYLKSSGFKSEESGQCGLHIHIGKDFFSESDITRLRLFFHFNKKEIEKFSRRRGQNTNYCEFERLTVKDYLNNVAQSDRRHALNLKSSENTIEVRVFRGTLDYKCFISTLQFVEAMSWFVKEHGTTSIINYGTQHKLWSIFIDWCRKESRYNTFVKYCIDNKFD